MEKSELNEGERYILEDCLSRTPAIDIRALKAELETSDKTMEPPMKEECEEYEDCELMEIGNEDIMKQDVARYLFNRLIIGTSNEELIIKAKEIIGEKEVNEIIKRAEDTPAKEREKLIEYLNSFK